MNSLERNLPAWPAAGPAGDSALLASPSAAEPGFLASGTVSCIIPCLNEYENLTIILPTLRALLERHCAGWEIIVVDDGSTDATPGLMAHWSAVDGMRYVQLSRNFGKEAALAAGLEAADGDAVICLDADMQHPPELIPQMLERWRDGADMVYAVRRDRVDEGWIKRTGAKMFYRMLNGTRGVKVPAHAGDFRLMDRKVVEALIALPERTRFMKGLYAWVGFRAEPLPYMPMERHHGKSRFNLWKLIALAADGLTAFTTWPLRVASLVGAIFAFFSFCYGCFLVGSFLLEGNPVSGWTTIVTALLFFAGINLLSLGVMGEYVARIFDEVKERPLFIARQRRGRARQARAAQTQ
ncbi:glycosyl transferase family protein [Bordetella ansorpii]|uniref:Glycosyl transferase family protein n=1 Tax=Bordetella ansorpii TaxID=288768 RepID=A0A157QJJ3_9BORD|nr:glycosyltransferase family 2 protein [Bordetella ansorpii]SAI45784.1 glycosyl transferase family protein [Bordetella ansorpii]